MNGKTLRVAVQAPIPGLFDYVMPVEQGSVEPGCRVLVPFGRGKRVGIAWQISACPDNIDYQLKPILRQIDARPLLGEPLRQLLGWCADYYHHPLGDVVSTALPLRLRQESDPVEYRERYWQCTASCPPSETIDSRAQLQKAVIALLEKSGEPLPEAAFGEIEGDIRGSLKRLEDKGWIRLHKRYLPYMQQLNDTRLLLNAAQQQAVETIKQAHDQFRPMVLQGVTGSGKTEVYIRAAQAEIDKGRQVLVLVPEIALTPQLLARFQQGVAAPVVSMHSGLSDGERERAWLAIRAGDARLLVGTRSAVFAEMPELGLILIDEEHDQSYKQQEGFRYAARDVAVMRAKQLGIPVVMGSATPSLETLYNLREGRYQRLRLDQRAGNAMPPRLEALDIRSEHLHGGLSARLIRAMRETLQAKEQIILFLNRRGYAPQLTCSDCGWIAECAHCDARMTFHAASHSLWCHHCGYQQPQPKACPECACDELVFLGQGTERLEETVQALFSGVALVRVDRDTTRRKGSLEAHLEQMRAGKPGIMIGTQMVAKGHDFPNVTLVGILNIDQGLLHPDFRSPERTAQLLLQVAGRAGRGSKPGRVLVQTRNPEHPLLQKLLTGDYESFAESALKEREEAAFPPYSFQLLLRAESKSAEKTAAFLELAANAARAFMQGVEIWGPVPAPMERKAGQYRGHLLLQAAERAVLHAYVDYWVKQLRKLKEASSVRWSLDVDPQEQL